MALPELQHLVADHRDRIYTFAYYSLRHREDAEDATQEVLVRLWKHHQRLEPETIQPWILRVTRNVCCDVIRRRQRTRARIAETTEPERLEQVACPTIGPQRSAEAAEIQDRLAAAVRQLSEPYRSVVILREIQGLKYHEIATTLKKPLNTVKVYLHRGRKMLREELREVEAYVEAC